MQFKLRTLFLLQLALALLLVPIILRDESVIAPVFIAIGWFSSFVDEKSRGREKVFVGCAAGVIMLLFGALTFIAFALGSVAIVRFFLGGIPFLIGSTIVADLLASSCQSSHP